jgi:hypothetical protein
MLLTCVGLSFGIGRGYLGKWLHKEAVKWLGEPSHSFKSITSLALPLENLQLNALHTYVRALLALEDTETELSRAKEILQTIKNVCSSQFLTPARLTKAEVWRQFLSLPAPARNNV